MEDFFNCIFKVETKTKKTARTLVGEDVINEIRNELVVAGSRPPGEADKDFEVTGV